MYKSMRMAEPRYVSRSLTEDCARKHSDELTLHLQADSVVGSPD